MMRQRIFEEIDDERESQALKWGNTDSGWGAGDCSSRSMRNEVKVMVLTEECGEVARAVLEHNRASLRKELVQVAAVCVAWLEALED